MCRITINNINTELNNNSINITINRAKDKKTLYWEYCEKTIEIMGTKLSERTMEEWISAARLVKEAMISISEMVKDSKPEEKEIWEITEPCLDCSPRTDTVIEFKDGEQFILRSVHDWRNYIRSIGGKSTSIRYIYEWVNGIRTKRGFSKRGHPNGYTTACAI